MSDTFGSPLTDWAAAPIGANTEAVGRGAIVDGVPKYPFRCPSPGAASPRRQRPPRAQQRQTSRPVADARTPRAVLSVNRAPTRALDVGADSLAIDVSVVSPRRTACGSTATAPVIRSSRGPGGPYPPSCRGRPWSHGRVFRSTNATRADSANRDQPSRLVHPRGHRPAARCPARPAAHRGLSIR